MVAASREAACSSNSSTLTPVAPSRLASLKLAPSRFVFSRLAPRRSASWRLAFGRSASVRSARGRWASVRSPCRVGHGKAGTVQVYTHHEGVGEVGLRKVGPPRDSPKGRDPPQRGWRRRG